MTARQKREQEDRLFLELQTVLDETEEELEKTWTRKRMEEERARKKR